jgi:2-haloalkanoic acid dehalogenase type II
VTEIRAATFDCYGTLVDWEGGLGSFLYQLAVRRGDPAPAPGGELRERWEELQFELVRGEYRRYREVLAESLADWSRERGEPFERADGEALLAAMRSWQPFPDTVPALRRARDAGLRLAIVSNTDRSIIEHTLRQLDGVDFDAVFVAEDCGAYKPSPTPFEHALGGLELPPEQVLHVAFGFKYDIAPAQQLGMRTSWVNRKRERRPGAAVPDLEWRDLWPLAEAA